MDVVVVDTYSDWGECRAKRQREFCDEFTLKNVSKNDLMMPEPCVKITYRYWKKLTYYIKKNTIQITCAVLGVIRKELHKDLKGIKQVKCSTIK